MSDYGQRLYAALVRQHEKLFDYQTKTLRPEYAQAIPCPVCKSENSSLFFTKDMFKFVKCNDCSMVYLNPRLNDQATYEFYNSDWTAVYNESKFEEVSESTTLDDQINEAEVSCSLDVQIPIWEIVGPLDD